MLAKTKKLIPWFVLLSSAAGCGVATSAGIQQIAEGQMSSGGRRASLGLLVSFGSYGSGIDSVAHEALSRFVAYGKRQGDVAGVETRKWGREGEIDYCVQFSSVAAWQDAIQTLGRLTAISRNQTYPTQLSAVSECNAGVFGQNHGMLTKPFLAPAETSRPTLTCEGVFGTGTYARLELAERIGTDGRISVALRLERSSPTARYALIEDVATRAERSVENTRSFNLSYLGSELQVSFWPEFVDKSVDYRANLVLGEQNLFLSCSNSAVQPQW